MNTDTQEQRELRNARLREGDIIFSSIPNPLYRQIARATGCPSSHVGILFRGRDGDWLVAESNVPCVCYTPLEKFIDRSIDGWHVVRRLKEGLLSHHVATLREECDRHMGTLYHSGFRYESRRTFCSKFVYQCFRHAVGVEVGRLETFAELLRKRPATAVTFWRLWFFGFIPWQRLTVTPGSQFESDDLYTVWDSHPELRGSGVLPGKKPRRSFVRRLFA